MSIQAKNIRNIVFAGHASKGKTTLCEALLNVAGTTERMGKTADANTVLDFDSEEKKRKISVNSAVASFEYKGKNINLIDTPGLFDFAMGTNEGMRAADTAVIVVSARSGLAVGAEKAFKSAGSHGLSRIFVTTKMEDERADFYKSFNGIVAKFGTQVCPVVVPVISDGKVVAYYNMIDSKAYEYDGTKRKESALTHDDEARFEAIKAVFAEAVASTDEELMDKYFEGEELTAEEKIKGLKLGVADGSIIPVFALSGITGIACDMLLDFIADVCPSLRVNMLLIQTASRLSLPQMKTDLLPQFALRLLPTRLSANFHISRLSAVNSIPQLLRLMLTRAKRREWARLSSSSVLSRLM